MQILLTDLVIGPNNAPLEDRPEALDRIGVDCSNYVLAKGVIDGLVRETTLQTAIARVGVGAEKAYGSIRFRARKPQA
jgi:hypothetical protein